MKLRNKAFVGKSKKEFSDFFLYRKYKSSKIPNRNQSLHMIDAHELKSTTFYKYLVLTGEI
jgi:hypothetical protein